MKPAFGYYGGKQRMSSKIIPLIPKHTVYVEPFAGGAAVFFNKPTPDTKSSSDYSEVLNDINHSIINFYKVLRDSPDQLVRACCLTPYSRIENTKIARENSLDPIELARRWFADINQSFAHKSRGGWAFGTYSRNHAVTWQNKCSNLFACADRMLSVHIECDDALKIIERWDSPQTFFYCDPPYLGTEQGHYSGYSNLDFSRLISALDSAEGSFILSNYEQSGIPDHWDRFEFTADCSANGKGRVGKNRDKSKKSKDQDSRRRTEVVWRRRSRVKPRKEIQKLYDSGKFDCFTGGD